ncbi:hypothetical protein [Microbulbifer sp. 2205BS26-8]|uniref:hypothetical protein n=1 Tax=Microbulbifer sp. 2205BS26-8 TaxID=3064386 RepID=UPI00273F6727|nr:hypothetical protein [Microbulbifer sp. 2205BS26-8]MDP5210238.1 hypothetical protein [Microbulbifer sp. 2205BS26-8]
MKYSSFLLIIIFFLVGCESKYTDISFSKEYSKIVGNKYRVKGELMLHGLTLGKNYGEKIDIYSVTESPGFSGPEVINRKTLSAGSVIEVIGARRCDNCFPSQVEFNIKLMSKNLTPEAPIWLADYSVSDGKESRELDLNKFIKIEN